MSISDKGSDLADLPDGFDSATFILTGENLDVDIATLLITLALGTERFLLIRLHRRAVFDTVILNRTVPTIVPVAYECEATVHVEHSVVQRDIINMRASCGGGHAYVTEYRTKATEKESTLCEPMSEKLTTAIRG